MKIAIFGATGGVGTKLVSQAFEAGHEITVLAREPRRIERPDQVARVIQGDVLDLDVVSRALEGQEAALCALGAPPTNNERIRARGTANIVSAMERKGVKRIVCLSTMGAGDSFNGLPFHFKYLVFPLILRNVLADHNNQEACLRGSSLDWIIVRAANLTNGPRTGQYHTGVGMRVRETKRRISRADVADFMLQQLTNNTFFNKAPGISY